MTREPREHGTLAMRRRGECRVDPCDACLDAGRRYARRNRKQRHRGSVPLVDAEPARLHVKRLLGTGMSVSQIENVSGIHRTAIRVLIGDYPNRKASVRIRPTTAAALFAVRPNRGAIGERGLVPVTGTLRRLRALRAIGYSASDLAQRCGLGHQLQAAKYDVVLASTANRVRDVYEALRDTPGPSSRARVFARAQGWLEPIWWDDDTIDDPEVQPAETRTFKQNGINDSDLIDEVAVRLAMNGTPPASLTAAEREQALMRLKESGMSDRAIGSRLGITGEAVLAIRRRIGQRTGRARVLVDDLALPRAERAGLMHKRGMSVPDIAEKIGVPPKYIRRDLAARRVS